MNNLGLFGRGRKPQKKGKKRKAKKKNQARYNQLGFVTVRAPFNLSLRSKVMQPF